MFDWLSDLGPLAVYLVGALLLAGIFLLTFLVYSFTPTARAQRKVRRLLRRLWRVRRRARHEFRQRERELDRAASIFVEAQIQERLASYPIESLKDEGAARVRWSALRDAGLHTLADIIRLPARRLALEPGIGDTTASRIVSAARKAGERIRSQPPELPSAQLQESKSPAVGRWALGLLDLHDLCGPAYAFLAEAYREGLDAYESVRRDTRLLRWLWRLPSVWRRERALEKAGDVASELEEVLLGARSAELAEGLRAAQTLDPRAWQADEIKTRVNARYADFAALIEESFERLGHREARGTTSIQGGIPEAIVSRVEAFPLSTQGLGVTLRGYQGFGAKYILAQRRTILGDEMGLGKTIEALAAMVHVWNEGAPRHFFVVAPAGLLWNWIGEVRKRAPFPAYALHGDELEQSLAEWRRSGGVAVTSYATLRNMIADGELSASNGKIDLFVADEAHYMKNPDARRTQAARQLIDCSEVVCLMSGTPLENHPREFLNLIRTVQPRVAGTLGREGEFGDRALAELRDASGKFHGEVAGVYLRRNQEDVLSELPKRIEVEEWVALGPGELDAYREAVLARNFMAMRQATILSAEQEELSAKFERLEELLEDHGQSERKVLVFSYFLDVISALEKRFEALGTITGKTPPVDRMGLVERFQAHEGHALLLCQITAAGLGLNLQSASVVVLMEPQLKPTTEDQAIARAHRMGQTQPVVVHRLLARDSVDERILQLVSEKRELFEAYARKSAVKSASSEATQPDQAQAQHAMTQIVEQERERLGLLTGLPSSPTEDVLRRA